MSESPKIPRKKKESSMLGAVLHYLERGWNVIPVKPDKGPYLTSWKEYQRRRITEQEAREMWGRWPNAGIAVLTGELSGIVVIDADDAVAIDEVESYLPTATLAVVTGRGGKHYYFEHPGEEVPCTVRFMPGTDSRGDGGYVVVPPSIHRSGRKYHWEDPKTRIASIPSELLAKVKSSRQGKLKAEDWVQDITHGERDKELTRRAGRLLQAGMPPAECLSVMYVVNATHCKPPLGTKQVQKIVKSIAGREAGKPEKTGKKLKVKTAVEMEREYRHEENWIVDDWLPEGACVLVSGSPESYKSWLTTELAVAVADGRPFLRKYAVKQPGVCLIIQKEDSWPLTMDRIRILCTEPGAVEESVKKGDVEWKFSLPRIPERLLFEDSRLFRFDDGSTMVELENLLVKYRPALVVIDPLYATAKAKDYMMEVAGLMNKLKPLRDKYSTSFVVVHHSSKWGKGTGRAGAWGSVFLNAWGEVTWAMNEIADGKVEVQRTYKGTEKFVKLVLDFKIDEEGFRVGVSRREGDTEIEKNIKHEQIRELHRQGDTQRQIGEKLKISLRTVSEALKKPAEEGEENDE